MSQVDANSGRNFYCEYTDYLLQMCKASNKASPEYCGPLPQDQRVKMLNPTPPTINATYIGTTVVENVEMHEFEFVEFEEIPEVHGNFSVDDPDPSTVTMHKVMYCRDGCYFCCFCFYPMVPLSYD